jgi:hypothetical protein
MEELHLFPRQRPSFSHVGTQSAKSHRPSATSLSSIRRQQMAAIEQGGNSIKEWLQFLEGEEKRGISIPELVQCYYRATNSIPASSDNVRSDQYVRIWLNYAKLQMYVKNLISTWPW